MRVLITNDDGIHAPGLISAKKVATELAGPVGEVWTVAPMSEMSGVSHCISYTKPVRAEQLDDRTFSIDGTPADCVLVALGAIMADAPPDLVLSGVNAGNNSGENAVYSGTVGAALEAALQGVRSVALSQFFGPQNTDLANRFEASEAHSADIIRTLLDKAKWSRGDYNIFYNINVPPLPASEVLGSKLVAQGRRPNVNFAATPYDAPNRRKYFWIHGSAQHVASAPGTDVAINLDGYVSITPCTADLTEHPTAAELADIFD